MSAACLIFPFGGYDLHTTLALGLGFLCHGALHVVGEGNVFDLNCCHQRAPRLGVPVDHILDLLVDARGIRKKLIKAKSSNNCAPFCLADSIDRVADAAPRTPSNFPRRKTTPRSYCRNIRNRAEDIQSYRERKNIGPATVAHITMVVEQVRCRLWGAPVRGSKTCGGKTRWTQTAV